MGFDGSSMGLLLGRVILDAKSVSSVVPMLILPFILFSGFFKNRDDQNLYNFIKGFFLHIFLLCKCY